MKYRLKMLRLLIILAIATLTLAVKELHLRYKWDFLDYEWKCEKHKQLAICNNTYNKSRTIPVDMLPVEDGRMFLTTPSYFPYPNPASLSTVSPKKGRGGNLLRPYPSWEWHNAPNCTGMISVWRITIDDCGRLWVLDSGKIGQNQVCPAVLYAFDLKTDQLVERIPIPKNVSHNPIYEKGRLTYPVVETEGPNCERTLIYAADFEGGGIVICSGTHCWRRDDDIFHPPAMESDTTIAGEKWAPENGLFGFALTPGNSSTGHHLFFRGVLATKQSSVATNQLHDWANRNMDICTTTSKYTFPGTLGAQAFSPDGIMFFGMNHEIAIGCWNSKYPMNAQHVDIVAQDDETLQFAGGIKVLTRHNSHHSHHSKRHELWILTNRFQKMDAGTGNFSEVNFRIYQGFADELVRGTKCEIPRRPVS